MTRFNHRCGKWILTLLLLAFSGCKPSPQPSSKVNQPQPDGHTRMLALLNEIKDSRGYEREFFGEKTVKQREAELASIPVADAAKRFELCVLLGKQHLFLGHNQEAVEHLLVAYDLLPKVRNAYSKSPWEETVFQLAVAYLRIAETENCVNCRNGESCLLPISDAGVHTEQAGSRNAIKYLEILLARNDRHLASRWLLNIAYMTIGGYPADVPKQFLIPPEAFASDEEFPRFHNIAAGLGLDTVSLAGGSIVDDFDNDGFLDIVTSSWGAGDQIRFFRNNKDGTFTERTDEAGLTGLYGGLNLIQADYDNDGDLDIFVLRGAWLGEAGQIPNSLLQNDGKARFRDVTFEAGLGEAHYPTQTAAWADYDNDGDLDLYVGNENYPSQLFQNNGSGSFTDVALIAGVKNRGFTKGVTWGDFDNDRFPDLYVSNLNGENRLYRNQGNGTFVDVARRLGVAGPEMSFPVWFWDFNNDGALDLFVSSYPWGVESVAADYLQMKHAGKPDRLYQGDGRGGFRDVAAQQNLRRVTQPMGSNFGDLDNDGFPDFYLGTGYPGYEGLMPNLMLRNRGGTGFSDVTTAGGFGHLQKGHGVAFADLDHDGDQDIFVELGGAYTGDFFGNALFENPGFGNHWITIRLIGKLSNRSAIGVRLKLTITESGKQRDVYKWVNTGGSFGANPLRQEIGLGQATKIDVLEVFWPSTGRTQRFHDVATDQFLEITEGEPQFRRFDRKPVAFSLSATVDERPGTATK